MNIQPSTELITGSGLTTVFVYEQDCQNNPFTYTSTLTSPGLALGLGFKPMLFTEVVTVDGAGVPSE
ncbi:hypothetical protein D3C79_1022160 [compost metagenome]